MRQSTTLKRAVIIGATAVLGICVPLGVAQAAGAATSEPGATVAHPGRAAGYSAEMRDPSTGGTKPTPRPGATVAHSSRTAGASAEMVDLRTGRVTPVPFTVTRERRSGEGPVFCYEPVDGEAGDGTSVVSGGLAEPGPRTSAVQIDEGKGGDQPEFCYEPVKTGTPTLKK